MRWASPFAWMHGQHMPSPGCQVMRVIFQWHGLERGENGSRESHLERKGPLMQVQRVRGPARHALGQEKDESK